MTNPEEVKYCVRCGSPTRAGVYFGISRPACPACGWIFFADPKVAAAVLVEQDGRVLLTRRVNEPYQRMWSLPAGFIDAHEDPAEAAVRECLEETGLQVRITGLLDVIAGREHAHGADFVIVYRAEVIGGRLQAGDDADEAVFHERANLPPLAFRVTRIVLGQAS